MTSQPRHRAAGRPLTRAYPIDFAPKHCAGTACFHRHADESEPPVGTFRLILGGGAP